MAEAVDEEARTEGRSAGKTRSRGPWWRRRGLRIAAVVCLVLVVAAGYAMRTPSPVGHWDSADGRARFMAAYDTAFEDMPEVERTLDVRTDFGVVRVYRFDGEGDGTPMLLLPGTSSGTPVWADNMPSLLEIGDVYTMDLLGEPGMSVQDRPIRNPEEHAAWLHQAIGGLPEERIHLVGLSIGGWTAANLAVHRPAHIETLTLIDPVFTLDDMPLETIVRSIPASVPSLPKSWRDGFNSYTAGGAEVEDVPVADMIEAGMQHYRMKNSPPTRISEEQLGTLEMPMLVFVAGQSVMHDSRTAEATAERALPEATIRMYADASHAINGEYPEEVAADIAQFLDRQ